MRRYRYKQLVLLLAVLVLPSAAILLLGSRDFSREQEKRSKDAADRVKVNVREELLQVLERGIKLQEVSGAPPSAAVVLVGRVEGNGLVFSWDADRAAASFRAAVDDPAFRRAVLEAGRAEYVDKSFDAAADRYRELVRDVRNESQRLQARALLAGALTRSGSASARKEALAIWRDVLKRPTGLVNENGIPWAYIAATALGVSEGRGILDAVAAGSAFPSSVTPVGMEALQPVLEAVAHSGDSGIVRDSANALDQLARRRAFLDRAESLRRDFAKLNLTAAGWRAYPSPMEDWLVSLTSESAPRVIAVRADSVFREVASKHQSRDDDPAFTLSIQGAGTSLGEELQDLHIALDPQASPNSWTAMFSERPAYVLSLLCVVLLTFIGGYLLWRDTRREIRLAELRTQFVSSVSHELKTPLTGIRMCAELLQMQGTTEARAQNEQLDSIVSETERLSRLVNNVLDFSRIERGEKSYHRSPAVLSEIVEAAARAMLFPLRQRGFEFKVELAENVPVVSVDRDAVEQAVLNLLSNAMKYSGEGREIELKLSAGNGNAAIQVSDHGIGIPPEEQKRIFDRFYRVQTADNIAISGTGLGLSLVAHIVEAHGGRVEVQSAVGQGSTFTLYFPIQAEVRL